LNQGIPIQPLQQVHCIFHQIQRTARARREEKPLQPK